MCYTNKYAYKRVRQRDNTLARMLDIFAVFIGLIAAYLFGAWHGTSSSTWFSNGPILASPPRVGPLHHTSKHTFVDILQAYVEAYDLREPSFPFLRSESLEQTRLRAEENSATMAPSHLSVVVARALEILSSAPHFAMSESGRHSLFTHFSSMPFQQISTDRHPFIRQLKSGVAWTAKDQVNAAFGHIRYELEQYHYKYCQHGRDSVLDEYYRLLDSRCQISRLDQIKSLFSDWKGALSDFILPIPFHSVSFACLQFLLAPLRSFHSDPGNFSLLFKIIRAFICLKCALIGLKCALKVTRIVGALASFILDGILSCMPRRCHSHHPHCSQAPGHSHCHFPCSPCAQAAKDPAGSENRPQSSSKRRSHFCSRALGTIK